jgi:hypothetical protein
VACPSANEARRKQNENESHGYRRNYGFFYMSNSFFHSWLCRISPRYAPWEARGPLRAPEPPAFKQILSLSLSLSLQVRACVPSQSINNQDTESTPSMCINLLPTARYSTQLVYHKLCTVHVRPCWACTTRHSATYGEAPPKGGVQR